MDTKYALVTGASRGIGRAIAIQLAKDGYFVIINYKINHEAAKEVLQQILDNGGQAELLPFDVSDPTAINAAMDDWQSRHKDEYIEVLVNNAGIVRDNLMLDMPAEDWHAVVETNLNGFFYITRRVLEDMIVNHHGRIINMTSVSGIIGGNGQVNYSTAKAALIGATKSLAREVASKKVTVNAIAAGYVATEMTQDISSDVIRSLVPMRRMGKAEEVADLVSFLVSDKAGYITGQVIGINGGMI